MLQYSNERFAFEMMYYKNEFVKGDYSEVSGGWG